MKRYNWSARTRIRPGHPHWREHWEIVRQVGWVRYVLLDHGLITGGLSYLGFVLLKWLFPLSHPLDWQQAMTNALSFIVIFCVLGAAKWWNCERQYRHPENPPKEPVS